MSVYSQESIEGTIKQVFVELGTSEDFLRLMSNDGKDGLDIASTLNMVELYQAQRLIPLDRKLDPNTDKGSYVLIYLENGSMAGTSNKYQNNVVFNLEILCHKDVWLLDEDVDNNWRVRPYRLLEIVKEKLENIETNASFRGRLNVGEPRRNVDFFYSGYRISFEITGSTSLSC